MIEFAWKYLLASPVLARFTLKVGRESTGNVKLSNFFSLEKKKDGPPFEEGRSGRMERIDGQ
jgi:hypothetical protein